jgi:hypothetical protein
LVEQKKGLHTKFLLKSNEDMKLKDAIELLTTVKDISPRINWSAKPHTSKDFFDSVNCLPVLPNWSPSIRLKDGLKEIN